MATETQQRDYLFVGDILHGGIRTGDRAGVAGHFQLGPASLTSLLTSDRLKRGLERRRKEAEFVSCRPRRGEVHSTGADISRRNTPSAIGADRVDPALRATWIGSGKT